MSAARTMVGHVDSSTSILCCAAFIGLNILDSCLTAAALGLGSYELNLLLSPTLGANAAFKWLISSAVVLILVLNKRGWLLRPLNVGMGLVCAWNIVAILTWI
jgi:hypothetical protein